jgi:hypothetical protein
MMLARQMAIALPVVATVGRKPQTLLLQALNIALLFIVKTATYLALPLASDGAGE